MAAVQAITGDIAMKTGDEVAILISTNEVCGLAKIVYIGPAVVELDNGRQFFSDDGKGLHDNLRIVPATDEHRAKLSCAVAGST